MSKAEPVDVHVGKRVRMRRLMLHMSQGRLGDALGITFQQVQKYEKGTNRISASRLQQIAGVLDVSAPFFFEGLPEVTGATAAGDASGAAAVAGTDSALSYVSDFLACKDGVALTQAFVRIKEPELRRSIVSLVEAIATVF